ncbi:MAG: ABC transporter permease, partial [Chitinophagaceae bacterium]
MRKSWWKILCVVLLVYAIVGGLLLPVPAIRQLQETIRNLYYHVSMWFAMMILFTTSVVYSIKHLRTLDYKYDIYAREYAAIGLILGLLGYSTG